MERFMDYFMPSFEKSINVVVILFQPVYVVPSLREYTIESPAKITVRRRRSLRNYINISPTNIY